MNGTVRNLLIASALLVAGALGSVHVGNLRAAQAAPSTANVFAQQFFSDPGDGWMLTAVFLTLIALAFAFAAGMLWLQERKQ